MKEDQLITFETAKLARSKGFNWNCNNYTSKRDGDYFSSTNILIGYKNWNVIHETWSIPTQSLLQKWLRDKHNIDIDVCKLEDGYKAYAFNDWNDRIKQTANFIQNRNSKSNTYENALEIALLEGLKLI